MASSTSASRRSRSARASFSAPEIRRSSRSSLLNSLSVRFGLPALRSTSTRSQERRSSLGPDSGDRPGEALDVAAAPARGPPFPRSVKRGWVSRARTGRRRRSPRAPARRRRTTARGCRRRSRARGRLVGAGGREVARGRVDAVLGIPRVGDPVAVGVHAPAHPARGHELHPAESARRARPHVLAEVGLDLVDGREDLPRDAVAVAGRCQSVTSCSYERSPACAGRGRESARDADRARSRSAPCSSAGLLAAARHGEDLAGRGRRNRRQRERGE